MISMLILFQTVFLGAQTDSLEQELETVYQILYNDFDRADSLYEHYYTTLDSVTQMIPYAMAVRGKAIIAYLQNDYDTAIKLYEQAGRFFEKGCRDDKMGRVYYNLALAWERQGDLLKSVDYALAAYENGVMYSNNETVIVASIRLGNLYNGIDLKESTKYFERGLEAAIIERDTFRMQDIRLYLAEIYVKNEKYAEADSLLQQVEPYVGKLKPTLDYDYYNVLFRYTLEVDIEQAMACVQRQLEYAEKYKFEAMKLGSLINAGILHKELKQYDLAEAAFLKAAVINERRKESKSGRIIANDLSEIYAVNGDYMQALHFMNKLHDIGEHYESKGVNFRIASMAAEIDANEKNKIILQQKVQLAAEANKILHTKIVYSNWLSLGLVFLFLIVWFFVWRWRLKRKAYLKSLELNNLILEQSHAQKRSFIDSLSHELRTPLYTIHGVIEILKDKQTEEQWQHYLNVLYYVTNYFSFFIENILTIKGEPFLHVETKPLHIKNMVHGIVESIQALGTTNTFEIEIERGLEEVYGDLTKLNKIMFNLIHNANKYTQVGEVKICAQRITETVDTVLVYFAVIDNGVGIKPEDKQKIFEKFNYHSSRSEGVGIGLNVVNMLLEVLGGHLDIESELGTGSTFSFTIHLAKKSVFVADGSKPLSNTWQGNQIAHSQHKEKVSK